ncbi:MAG: DNA mismatch repair endonuclease MutL [Chitinophagaceae bacterium]|nr:DNA mismatch repair endonuclease MutL [Chitinophagaceae bacterium]MCA6486498.1 DNA mismatch repair endonuclease MutL [Chitinophagaceae bacterium]MCA6493989.1 DNA mismatch repair endonuclease MutL [Chitinophagaceae bacterium]MCA6499574.1 DNA mismatch repair endonuclease MutL [Chitinophagaceae bacterium]
MENLIQLLPEHLANQIAAGEVIQRPASAVKELLENAADAGATRIQLVVTDAGKALIQVIDNGRGMSETDARMAFERHATSKIRQIDDLFRINTMGFRGEALASIAAVAQVELKTRRPEDELGTHLEIENSKVVFQEPCSCPAGTQISMKNLFFSVPARRNFLKNNAVEMRHIIDEFIRVALAFPGIAFSLQSNGQEVFHLEPGNNRQRIIQLLGNAYQSKLVSVTEDTDYMNIRGYVGKPETARKTRGDQYFFVNNRFIKSAYLNHAVNTAFENLLPKDSFPTYILYIEVDPSQVDINVHPTKQEIKFEDEKIIYAFVQAAVKHALAQFSVAPSLDFSLNPDIQQLDAIQRPFTEDDKKTAGHSSLFQTFSKKNQAHFIEKTGESTLSHWKEMYRPSEQMGTTDSSRPDTNASFWEKGANTKAAQGIQLSPDVPLVQLHQTYIIATTTDGFLLIHQQLAHERILYEKYSQAAHGRQMPTQKSLFPVLLNVGEADAALLSELLPDLSQIGYQIEKNESGEFVIQGIPADVLSGNEKNAIELLLEQFKHFSSEVQFSKREKLIRCMARQQAIKAGRTLAGKEMAQLIEELFTCGSPNVSPSGAATYISFSGDYLTRMFGR